MTSVGRYRLSLQGVKSDTQAAGQLFVSQQGVPPGSVPVSIGPEPNLVLGEDDPLVVSAFIAVVLFIIGLAVGGNTDFGRLIPTVSFDFGKSFASVLTAVGAR